MYEIKRVIIALDFSDFDDKLIEYILKLAKPVGIEQLYFVHVVKTLDMPDSIAEKYPDLIAPQDEAIKNQIEFNIKQWINEAGDINYHIDVLEGNITEEILRWAQIKNVDLILLGQKANRASIGVNSGKIAKLAPCSVEFFTGQMPDMNKKILVPIDFSENSKMALEQAIEFCTHYQNAIIQCLHVYSIPQGYHYSGKSIEEYESIMQTHSKKDFEKFISMVDDKGISIDFEFVNSEDENIAGVIYSYAIDRNCTGICIGSKGRTQAASLILGSVSENLIIQNKQFPVFVVKQRNQNMDIFSAIMKGSH